jgi:hypothetical protein
MIGKDPPTQQPRGALAVRFEKSTLIQFPEKSCLMADRGQHEAESSAKQSMDSDKSRIFIGDESRHLSPTGGEVLKRRFEDLTDDFSHYK